MHGLQACLFEYITVAAFRSYLSVVKIPLKGEVGGHTLKSHVEITLLIMENHGIIIVFLNFCGNRHDTVQSLHLGHKGMDNVRFDFSLIHLQHCLRQHGLKFSG